MTIILESIDQICFTGIKRKETKCNTESIIISSTAGHRPLSLKTTTSSSTILLSCRIDEEIPNNRRVIVEYVVISDTSDAVAAVTSSASVAAASEPPASMSLSNVLLQILDAIQHNEDDNHHNNDYSSPEDNHLCYDPNMDSHSFFFSFFTRERMTNITSITIKEEKQQEEEPQPPQEVKNYKEDSCSSFNHTSVATFMIPFDLLSRVFPNFHGSLTIANCPNITSSHLDDFTMHDFGRHVTHLYIDNCPGLTCLGFLAKALQQQQQQQQQSTFTTTTTTRRRRRIRRRMNLESLSISNCGLIHTSNNIEDHSHQDWDDAMKAWSMTTTSLDVELSICNCPQIQSFPLGIIHHLKDKLSILNLRQLPKLTRLPAEIGQLQYLKMILLEKTGITHLPFEMGRLNVQHCLVAILDCGDGDDAGSGDSDDAGSGGGGGDHEKGVVVMKCPPKCYRGSIQAMQRYFTIKRIQIWKGWIWLYLLFRRARLRALERLYQPGGRGYKRCRDRFLKTMVNVGGDGGDGVGDDGSSDGGGGNECDVLTKKRCK
jgi:hypothetical protein